MSQNYQAAHQLGRKRLAAYCLQIRLLVLIHKVIGLTIARVCSAARSASSTTGVVKSLIAAPQLQEETEQHRAAYCSLGSTWTTTIEHIDSCGGSKRTSRAAELWQGNVMSAVSGYST